MNDRMGSLTPAVTSDPLRYAFTARRPVMPRQDKQAVSETEIPRRWAELEQQSPAAGKRLAYINIPFCRANCLYCGFYRHRSGAPRLNRYVDLLIEEIRRDAALPLVGDRPIHAVYLGGGTPSDLPAGDLQRLLAAVRECLPLAADCEITLEARIAGLTEEKIRAAFAGGVNRISVGVQSFDTRVRRRQGRVAAAQEVVERLVLLAGHDQGAVIADLMFGLPDQDLASWHRDLDSCQELGLDGLDTYALKLIPGTPLQKLVERGCIEQPAGLPEQAEFYAEAVEALSTAGWRQISNSHWARTPRERNLYNLLIKSGAETLAFGAGAGGSREPYTFANTPDMEAYERAVAAGDKPVAMMRVSDALQPLRDTLMGGVEIGRLELPALRACMPMSVQADPSPWRLVDRWVEAGLAERRGEQIHLTVAGRFWAPNLVTGFQQVCAQALESGRKAHADG
ncbi:MULTISPECIES: heme anaerobic degradation radical SAM methyltransferase ChuW/HutW [Halorhodospira]|uniref:heme anaerobic degradation radical SAM methyltransferase ChuW/HutW n=2 Tax=Ectothiorhodospiraceae TaxID=72276 RepID=UPI001EE98382|nr:MULTISPECIES: heme anaerobic degradation radical SAM methyltransferase ChuW/HutW [Halorhodospira]MCG5528695.1 heme anaerobic degradation radical SAM methyltransferase ChuW/HutW [Halorhodospira halophila]MCG5544022.1 heme anaerobic degradation radical SAM methyltransferase ChuW/HutW [Halorhodospira sp. 9628]